MSRRPSPPPEVSAVNAHRAALFTDRAFQLALTRPQPRRFHAEDHEEATLLELHASELREAFYRPVTTIARLDAIREELLEIEAVLNDRAIVNWNFRQDTPAPAAEPIGWDALDEFDAEAASR